MKLTWERIVNVVKAEVSYCLSRFGVVRIKHLPTFVSVEPANICQLHCPQCPVGKGERLKVKGERLMSMEVFRRVLEQVGRTAHTIQFYFQGEPLLNKSLPQMIREAHEAGLYTLVSTNAQALTQEMAEQLMAARLDRIIVSMDGLTQESYAAYRVGGSVEKVKMGLKYLRSVKERLHGHTHIELQCLYLQSNEHEWRDFSKLYKALGADSLSFKTAQFYDYTNGNPLIPSTHARYIKGEDGHYHPRRQPQRHCHRLWTGCVVTVEGEVLPCCYDKGHQYSVGNILSESIRDIWQGDRHRTFMQRIVEGKFYSICLNCQP